METMTHSEYKRFVLEMWQVPGDFDLNVGAMVLGLTEESGEVAGKVRKFIQGRDLKRDEILKELGDVLFFWTAIADIFGISLEEAMLANHAKLVSRRNRNLVIGEGDNR